MRTAVWFKLASLLATLLVVAIAVATAEDKKDKPKDEDREPDIVWVGSPTEVVDKMLEVAKVTDKDIVYDLGCGDGRILIAAAKKYKCKAIGCDIDPERVKDSEAAKAKEAKDVQERITIKKADMFKFDFEDATVVALYLVPDMNEKLVPKFKKLKDGSRIVSHQFHIPGVVADKGYPIILKTKDTLEPNIYLYTTPLKFEEAKKTDKDAKDDKKDKGKDDKGKN